MKQTVAKQTVAFLLVLLILFGLMACAAESSADREDTPEEARTQTDVAEMPEKSAEREEPLFDEPTSFSIWVSGNVLMDPNMTSFNETPAWQEVQRRTNVTPEWEMVSTAAASEQFNLMMVSQSYPDIIQGGSFSTRGYQYYLDEDILVDLEPYITDGFAPNYQAIRMADDNVRRDTMLDSGSIAVFYRILTTVQQSWKGLIANKTAAEVAGINVDEICTLDQLHDLLEIYRDAGMRIPYHLDPSGFDSPLLTAFGISGGGWNSTFTVVDDQIQYSYIMPEYYDYLCLARKWYEEGLIEAEFFGTVSDAAWDMSILNDGVGVTFAASTVVELFKGVSGTEYRAILTPMQNEGDVRKVAQIAGCTARTETACGTVTTACSDIEAVIKFLDYFYSEEMFALANYGIENLTYTRNENGTIEYTDLFLKDEENNWTAKSQYYALWGTTGFQYAWDAQKIGMPESVLYAYDLWDQNYADERTLPSLSLTADEMELYASRYGDISTYTAEMAVKFITGQESLNADSYADYVARIKAMNIDDCLGVYQAAYERYLQR